MTIVGTEAVQTRPGSPMDAISVLTAVSYARFVLSNSEPTAVLPFISALMIELRLASSPENDFGAALKPRNYGPRVSGASRPSSANCFSAALRAANPLVLGRMANNAKHPERRLPLPR